MTKIHMKDYPIMMKPCPFHHFHDVLVSILSIDFRLISCLHGICFNEYNHFQLNMVINTYIPSHHQNSQNLDAFLIVRERGEAIAAQ